MSSTATGTMSSAMQECRWALEDIRARIDELHDGNNATSEERRWARRLADHLDAWDDDDHAPPPATTPGKAFYPALAALPAAPDGWEWHDRDVWGEEAILVPRAEAGGDDSTGFEDLMTGVSMLPATVTASAMVTTDDGDDDLGF